MNILWFEDRGEAKQGFIEDLKKNHNVFEAKTVRDARSYWEESKIELIIADLLISPTGLTQDEKTLTKGGKFTGWIWLKNYVFNTSPEMKQKTIIVSRYINDLKKTFPNEDFKGISFVNKKSITLTPKLTNILEIKISEIGKKRGKKS